MADKNEEKIEKSDTTQMLANVKVKTESSISIHEIKGASIEQFTKVSSCMSFF